MRFLCAVALGFVAASCSRPEPQQSYTLNGQVLSVEAPRKQLTIKHGEIKGLMPAMTMPYSVRDDKLLADVAPGDLVDATLVVVSNDAYLTAIKKVGHETPPPPPPD